MTWGASALGIGVVVILSAWALRSSAPAPDYSIPGEGERIVVEVLNGAAVDGLARETTRRLRSRGIDVVYFGTAWDSVWKTTEVLVRRGDTGAGRAVRDALGTGRVVERPDSQRLLDVTIILGRDVLTDSGETGLHP